MKPRSPALALAHREELTRAHRDLALARWKAAVPGKYWGHDVEEAYQGWSGRLGRADAAALRAYVGGKAGRFLLLRGGEGLGKSTLAATVAAQIVGREGVSAAYRSAPIALSSFSYRSREVDPVAELSSVPVLVLDDLGAGNEGITAVQERGLWSVIDARWANPATHTIVTTNMAVTTSREGIGLADYLGATAWARLSDDLTSLHLSGESFRGAR